MSDNVLSFNKKKNSRRKLLKEFYKLQESNKKDLEKLDLTQTPQPETDLEDRDDELTLESFDEFVKSQDFKTLILKENSITEQLNSNQGEIKSIVYNNYYEFIKISNYLELLEKGSGRETNTDNVEEDNDNDNEFTIGADDEDDRDSSLKILLKIRQDIATLKNTDLSI